MAAQRLVSRIVLLVWMAPSAGAFAVSLHVALDHHGPHDGAEHTLEISVLARAAAHGHHHDGHAASDHDHDVLVDGSTPSLKPKASWLAVLPASASPETTLAERPCLDGAPRRGPPDSLFAAHCSLLL